MDLLLILSRLWIISYSVLVEWLGKYLSCVLAANYLCHKGGWATLWLDLCPSRKLASKFRIVVGPLASGLPSNWLLNSKLLLGFRPSNKLAPEF